MNTISTRTLHQSASKHWFIKMSLPLLLLTAMILAPYANASAISADSSRAQRDTANRIHAIQRDLTSIRQQALQANPELIAQSKKLEEKFQQKAEEIGYEPGEFITKAQEIQQQVQDQSLSEKERSELIKEFTVAKQKMTQQRRAIIADKELMAMQDQLQQDMVMAMQAHDPKTEKLIDELNRLIEAIQ
ncbi:hypothetical protein [uncultured Photobacterium sp.]|uniref:hypothetical protein n=1 Tax=uncultured Photobacterium sp. TaxID=173973 RepID=UPI00261A16EE|nr:hypothetical protein [uncultured Photobacterium sp.]